VRIIPQHVLSVNRLLSTAFAGAVSHQGMLHSTFNRGESTPTCGRCLREPFRIRGCSTPLSTEERARPRADGVCRGRSASGDASLLTISGDASLLTISGYVPLLALTHACTPQCTGFGAPRQRSMAGTRPAPTGGRGAMLFGRPGRARARPGPGRAGSRLFRAPPRVHGRRGLPALCRATLRVMEDHSKPHIVVEVVRVVVVAVRAARVGPAPTLRQAGQA